jgi:hypothetical protein
MKDTSHSPHGTNHPASSQSHAGAHRHPLLCVTEIVSKKKKKTENSPSVGAAPPAFEIKQTLVIGQGKPLPKHWSETKPPSDSHIVAEKVRF